MRFFRNLLEIKNAILFDSFEYFFFFFVFYLFIYLSCFSVNSNIHSKYLTTLLFLFINMPKLNKNRTYIYGMWPWYLKYPMPFHIFQGQFALNACKTYSTFSDYDCTCGLHALLTSDLQERRGRDAYAPSVARSSSCPNPNTALLSKETKDLKGPYLLVPGIT